MTKKKKLYFAYRGEETYSGFYFVGTSVKQVKKTHYRSLLRDLDCDEFTELRIELCKNHDVSELPIGPLEDYDIMRKIGLPVDEWEC